MNRYNKIRSFLSICLFICMSSCISQNKKATPQETKKSIAEALAILPNASVSEMITQYHTLKEQHPEAYNFDDEMELNKLGYQFLNNGKIKEAIEIFKLLVAEFPDAYNPYDSLGEAYLADGNILLGIKNYEKSLALNPKNIHAEDVINKTKYADYDATRFHKTYSVTQYINDLDELARRLTEIHPNVYKFISKQAFWEGVEAQKKTITPQTTFSEFIWLCSEIIASINCGHTSMGYFHQERNMIPMELRFPMELRIIDDKAYVSNPLANKDKIEVKQEIVRINGIPFDTIKEKIYKHISSQGAIQTYKKNFFNAHSTAIIAYALSFPKTYQVTVKGSKTPIALVPLEEYTNNFESSMVNASCSAPLCLEYIEGGKVARMRIRSFAYYGNKFPEFKTFMDTSFKELKEKNSSDLIIDLRGNGGGPSDAGILFLQYISKQPFTYFSKSQFNEKLEENQLKENAFSGRIYITMDGNGNSTTGHVISLVKKLKLATLVGEELGANQFCTGGQKRLRLSNTGIQFSVARNTYVTTATSYPDDKGILPDYPVFQSIEDYLDNKDTVMEYTLELIRKSN
ncbi:S41 family peptidase [Aquimarina hainanensis]